jgi:hypothetical protein
MPYSNIVPVSLSAIERILAYLVEAEHDHHREYHLTPLVVRGGLTIQDFVRQTTAAFNASRRRSRRMRAGPRPKYAANWMIVRMPDQTKLSQEESAAYEAAACEEASHGEPLLGVCNWHNNKLTKAADFNLLYAAFSPSGLLLRDRDMHPIASLRRRMDRVTERLNMLRKQRGKAAIQTMNEVQPLTRQQRGTFVIEDELAKMPKPPRKSADLEPALLSIGCKVSRINLASDTISIVKPNGKKARRFSILTLLYDVRALTNKLREKPTLDDIV